MTDLPADATLWPAQAAGRVTLPGSDVAFDVPSRQAVTLQDVIVDTPSPDLAIYRFRFLTPAIARDLGQMDFEASLPDMQHLCDTYALAQIRPPMPVASQVIIAFSDRVLPFGETMPDATQFFVAFTVKDGVCVVEPF